jgi:hypothetical protein
VREIRNTRRSRKMSRRRRFFHLSTARNSTSSARVCSDNARGVAKTTRDTVL